MRKMFSDLAPWLLFVLLSITAVSAYRRDGVSRTDRDGKRQLSDRNLCTWEYDSCMYSVIRWEL